ncbi:MAG: lyase family protein [Parcubacteria group bacterium]
MPEKLRVLDSTIYQSPFVERYASRQMLGLLSDDMKFKTWRQVWAAIAKVRMLMNAGVTKDQVDEMYLHLPDPIDYQMAREFETRFGHDVIAHQRTFATACPLIGSLMHDLLTSCDITDNADLIIIRDCLGMIREKVVRSIFHLSTFANYQAKVSVLGYTHMKEASLVTVGKRVCGWIRDLMDILTEFDTVIASLKLRGIKGPTGTQAGFLSLFSGDHTKVLEAEQRFADELGFKDCYPITGQTYSRLIDVSVISVLSKLGAVVQNIGWDIRFWQHLNEVQEPFGEEHRGSSAMPFKKNPKYAERLCGLGRFLMFLVNPALGTYADQVFERTLDDSVCRRLFIPEAFLAADSVLRILQYIAQSPIVNLDMIQTNLKRSLPLMATERLLAVMVEVGGDRDQAYQRLQKHSFTAMKKMMSGGDNNFAQLVSDDPFFSLINNQLSELFDPSSFTGAAVQQTNSFLETVVAPAIDPYKSILDVWEELPV